MSAVEKINRSSFNSTMLEVQELERGTGCLDGHLRVQVSDSTGVYVVETAPVCVFCAVAVISLFTNTDDVHTITIRRSK